MAKNTFISENKTLIIVGGGLVGFYLVAKMFSGAGGGLLGLFGKDEDRATTDNSGEAAVNSVGYDPNKMTFTETRALQHADSLQRAMYKGGILSAGMDGTDESAIYDVFKQILLPDDMKCVYKKFGVRVRNQHWYGDDKGDLKYWLREEGMYEEDGFNTLMKKKLDWC